MDIMDVYIVSNSLCKEQLIQDELNAFKALFEEGTPSPEEAAAFLSRLRAEFVDLNQTLDPTDPAVFNLEAEFGPLSQLAAIGASSDQFINELNKALNFINILENR